MNIRIYDSNVPGQIISPMLVNSYSALTIPAYYRAINFLSHNLASFPRCIHKDGSPAIPEHPLEQTLKRRPNRYQNSTKFWQTLFHHTAHCANGYARIERALGGVTLHNLLPEHVWPFRIITDGGDIQQYYWHFPTKTALFDVDVIHLIAGLSHNGMKGLDPVALHSEIFQLGNSHIKYMSMYLQRGTVLRGAIEIPSGVAQEQVEEVESHLRTYFMGASAERDVIVLSDGAKLNNATLTPEQSQLIQQGAFITKQIAQITGVPPQFLYEFSEQKYNNIAEQIGQDVVRFTFRPWIEQIEDELSLKLLSDAEYEAGYRINLDPSALLRGNTKETEDIANASVNAGLRTRNEGRAILNLPADTDPDSDKLKVLGDTAAPPTKPEKTNKPAPPQDDQADSYSVIRPIINHLCEKIDAKTDKAFSGVTKKSEQERTIWGNVFSAEQEKHVLAAFTPITASLPKLDVAKIGELYAAGIRKRASSGEAVTLQSILEGMIPNKPTV